MKSDLKHMFFRTLHRSPEYRKKFMITDEQMSKKNGVYPYYGMLLILKRKEISRFVITQMSLGLIRLRGIIQV